MNKAMRTRWVVFAVAGWVLGAAAKGEDSFAAPRLGATVKGDVVNAVGVAGLKAWVLDPLAVEVDYVGVGGDITGYAIRGLFWIPTGLKAGEAMVRPFIGAGYADLEQEISVSGTGLSLGTDSIQWGVAGDGKITCQGSGLQVSCGVQANPFKSFPRLFLEAELLYSFFDVEGQGTSRVQGSGILAPYFADAEITVESDVNALSLLLGLTVYF
ncbi:MAG: hypothetical protein EOM72_06685 [Opitutae bacterium]|nr:hypothetical protein [Opitutae bacterium]